MATFKQANSLMDELTASAHPVSVAEDRVLQAFARNVTQDPTLKLTWWDNSYWAERMKEAKFKVKQEELRQYLPLDNVKDGLFKVGGGGGGSVGVGREEVGGNVAGWGRAMVGG